MFTKVQNEEKILKLWPAKFTHTSYLPFIPNSDIYKDICWRYIFQYIGSKLIQTLHHLYHYLGREQYSPLIQGHWIYFFYVSLSHYLAHISMFMSLVLSTRLILPHLLCLILLYNHPYILGYLRCNYHHHHIHPRDF